MSFKNQNLSTYKKAKVDRTCKVNYINYIEPNMNNILPKLN